MTSQKVKLSIVIPCYNERDNLPLLLDKLGAIKAEGIPYEVLLVENGSTDGSLQRATELLESGKYPNVRLVEVPENQGYGFGILQGLDTAIGETLAWTHADLQTNPQDVIRAYQELAFQGEHCLVKGKRRGRPLLDGMFTFGMQLVSFFYLKQYLDDINAQPKVFHRSFFETFRKSAPHDFSLDLHLLYLAKVSGLDIQSIDVTFEDRVHGEAKGGGSFKTKWKLIKRTLSYISELAQERARA